MSQRVVEVLPTREARAKLPSMLASFRAHGADADPVVIGAHRRPEAVVLSYERYLMLLNGRERVKAILADRGASSDGMGEDEAMEIAVREQEAAARLAAMVRGRAIPVDLKAADEVKHRGLIAD